MAVGVLVAKGVGKMVSGGGRSGAGGQGGGLGGLLGGLMGGGSGGAGGGLGGALGGALGGSGGGGLGNLGALLGGKGGGAGGGLGGLLESISGGGGANPQQSPSSGSLGGLLNRALQGEEVPEPNADQEAQARVMIKAMIAAAKADGNIDKDEQQKIVSHLGDDVTEQERQFVLSEMQTPLDTDGLVREVPKGSEAQVYMMSLMGIELDSQEEARYLDSLRQKLGLDEQTCNDIHQKLGVPTIYS